MFQTISLSIIRTSPIHTAIGIGRTGYADCLLVTNEMQQFLRFVFGIKLYMFRTISPSIIRSLALYTQQ